MLLAFTAIYRFDILFYCQLHYAIDNMVLISCFINIMRCLERDEMLQNKKLTPKLLLTLYLKKWAKLAVIYYPNPVLYLIYIV